MAEERMNNSAEERREVAIKFGKGLMGEPFTSKAGKQLVEIKIPNPDPKDVLCFRQEGKYIFKEEK